MLLLTMRREEALELKKWLWDETRLSSVPMSIGHNHVL